MELIQLGFTFEQKEYGALIDLKELPSGRVYRITIMNGELECLLYGNHFIKEVGGLLQYDLNQSSRQNMLKEAITTALEQYLQHTASCAA